MSKLLVIPFEKEHLHNIALPDGETSPSGFPTGISFTALRSDDNAVIACAGVIFGEPGKGIVWAIFSRETAKYKKELFVRMKTAFFEIIKNYGLVLIETLVCKNLIEMPKFIDKFGFRRLDEVFTVNGKEYSKYVMVINNG